MDNSVHRCAYCGKVIDIGQKHLHYRSTVQEGQPKTVWCTEPACWKDDPLHHALVGGELDKAEERVCLATIQARGPGRLAAGWEWWGSRYKEQRR